MAVSQSISSNVPSGAAAQRVEYPLGAPVLVVVEPQRLLAGVALRAGMGLVAADPLEAPAVLAAEADLDAAVALAEDARRLLPPPPWRSRHETHGECEVSSVMQLTVDQRRYVVE